MPRGTRKIVHGLFDAQIAQILRAVAEHPSAFNDVLRRTELPKATLHRGLGNLLKDRLVKKISGVYAMTSEGELVLAALRRLEARAKLKITDEDVRHVLSQAKRTMRMESSGFNRIEQFVSVQEAVESVKVTKVPA